MRKLIGTMALAATASSLVLASNANAAVEIGSHCVGDTYGGNATLVQIANDASDPLPAAAPSAGVITSWSVNVALLPYAVAEKLKVMRPTAVANQFTTIAESGLEAVPGGQNVTFETRIPVQAGDRLGIYTSDPSGTLFCSVTGKEGDVFGTAAGNTAVGSTRSFLASENNQLAVAAKIETDADADGFGDETQDKCPQSAAYQGPCPTISLEAFPIVLKRSVLVLVSASSESSVHVFGQVSWKVRQPGGARSSKSAGGGKLTGLIVGLNGGTRTVKAGEIGRFNVKLPKPVQRRLSRIPPSKALRGTITARATDLLGRTLDRTIKIRLRGQGRR